MATYTRADGHRWIMSDHGYGWVPQDGAYVRSLNGAGDGPTYTLEKRRKDTTNGTHTTGWYLSDDQAGGIFGEFTSSRILEAVDAADHMIGRAEKAARQQAPEQPEGVHKVTASLELDNDEVWDEPRTELTIDEVSSLRAGVVVEARTLGGSRVRVRLAKQPIVGGAATLIEATDGAQHEVRPETMTLIGVMPRKGDTIEATAAGSSKPMRRILDRDPWSGKPGSTVVSDGRGVDSVLTSSIVILADAPGVRTDEQRIARAVSLAMPGLDFHTNPTSTSAVRVRAVLGDVVVTGKGGLGIARNDDIAEALTLAGFFVARRAIGQAVYASVLPCYNEASVSDLCDNEDHVGASAPWIAVRPSGFDDSVHMCRDCIRRFVESERAIESADPERPYLVRMWDADGNTLRVSSDPEALDFAAAEREDQARGIVRSLPREAWRMDPLGARLVPVDLVTVDLVEFDSEQVLSRVSPILGTGLHPVERSGGPECSRIGCTSPAEVMHRWTDAGFTPPQSMFDAKCRPHGARGLAALGGSLTELHG